MAPRPRLEFFTGYLVEKSLSLDNIFVFLLVFRAFGVEPRFQHRVLFWGVLGALVMRGTLIGIGAVLVRRFAWILVALGAFLVVAGVRTALSRASRISSRAQSGLALGAELFSRSLMEKRASDFLSAKMGVAP